MSDPVTALDPQREAREALRSMVQGLGSQVLADASTVEGICEDRLADRPREARLIVVAAQADVAGMLAQQAAAGPDAAVRMTASRLADTQSIDPAASLWVTAEFARALGYAVSDDLAPLDAAGGHATPLGGGAPVDPDETIVEGETVVGGEPRRRRKLPAAAALGVVVLVAAAYIGTAAAAKLPPFASTKATTTTTQPPTPTTSSAALAKLQALVPNDIESSGHCKTMPHPSFGAIAEINCSPSTGLVPASYIGYYLFADQPSLTNAYLYFLGKFAGAKLGGTSCTTGGSFSTFVPGCETGWSNGLEGGRVVEYEYKSFPDMTTTESQRDVLVDMSGPDAGNLLGWWALNPLPWLVVPGQSGPGPTGSTGAGTTTVPATTGQGATGATGSTGAGTTGGTGTTG